MGWTDDPDEEGLIEENPFIFVIIGIIIIAGAAVLYTVGIEYDPGWFEGQNLISSMGIIFLLTGLPAIMISTFTGKSDLVKWEALFLFGAVFMILLGNSFDFSKAMESFTATISSLGNVQVNQLLMALLIIVGVGVAFAAASGKSVSGGAILLIIVLLVAIGLINMWNAGTFDNFSSYLQEKGIAYAIGKAIGDFTAGLATSPVAIPMGLGMIAIGLILVFIPNFSTPIGVLLIIIGCGLVGGGVWDQFWKPIFDANPALGIGAFGASVVGPGIIPAILLRLRGI